MFRTNFPSKEIRGEYNLKGIKEKNRKKRKSGIGNSYILEMVPVWKIVVENMVVDIKILIIFTSTPNLNHYKFD